jgi:hypothetical protein
MISHGMDTILQLERRFGTRLRWWTISTGHSVRDYLGGSLRNFGGESVKKLVQFGIAEVSHFGIAKVGWLRSCFSTGFRKWDN